MFKLLSVVSTDFLINMAKTKLEKKEIIQDLEKSLTNQRAVVFVDFQGLNAESLFELRDTLKNAGCLLKVTKKTLLGLAFDSLKLSEIKDQVNDMKGELALVFGSNDEIVPAKIVYEFSQKNESLKILGGMLKDKDYDFLTIEKVVSLALLPSKQELYARFLSTLNAPRANFVNVLSSNLRNFVCILSKIKVT